MKLTGQIMNFQLIRVLTLSLARDLRFLSSKPGFNINFSEIFKNRVDLSQHGNFLRFSDGPSKCWKCDFPHKSELFCTKCRTLQKLPEDLDYFDIIGVEKTFDIVVEDVQKKYRQLQTLLHPDRFGQKSDREKEISENLSSLVNKAYNTLLHPLDRGIYMLKLHNVTIPEGTTSLNPEFLMEVMEINEQVEEAHENQEKALILLQRNRETIAVLTKQISNAFSDNDIDKAKTLLIKMKYYMSIDNRLKKLKQDLGIVE